MRRKENGTRNSLYFASFLEVSPMKSFVTLFAAIVLAATLEAGEATRLVHVSGSEHTVLEPSARLRVAEGREFRLGIDGITTPKYYEIQWYKDGVIIPGATSAQLHVKDAQDLAAGVYTATYKNPCASRQTAPVRVVVEGADPNVTSTAALAGYALEDVRPNPVSDKAIIRFSVPTASRVQLRVVDVVGNAVATIVNADLPAGTHTSEFVVSGSEIPSTLYYVILSTPGFKSSRPMVVVK